MYRNIFEYVRMYIQYGPRNNCKYVSDKSNILIITIGRCRKYTTMDRVQEYDYIFYTKEQIFLIFLNSKLTLNAIYVTRNKQ